MMNWTFCECAEEEGALILRAQQGMWEAEEQLLLLYQPLIKSVSRRLLHGEESLCMEFVQAGNLGLLQAIRRYDPNRQVKLITYALPWILGEMRRALHRTAISDCSLDAPVGDAESSMTLADTIAGCLNVDIQAIDLRLALSRLPEEERTLICLRYYRDMTQKEAAQLLGKSQAQISRIERRALDALYAALCI